MNIANLLGTSAGASSAGATGKKDEYAQTKDEFLKLLLAQLKNQDPLSSPDVDKLAEQITSFGQLEQLMNLNKSMEGLSGLSGSYDKTQAIGMIGKKVDLEGSNLEIKGEHKSSVGYEIAEAAERVNVVIKDASGQTVRTIVFNNVPAGVNTQPFDGKSEAGADLPDGQYQIAVTAFAAGGRAISAAPLKEGVVTGVVMDPVDGVWVAVDGRYYPLDKIFSVRN